MVANIKIVTNTDKSHKPKVQELQNLSMADLKEYFQKKYPNESEEEIMVRVLDYMKNQFFSTLPTQASKDEDESMKTTSSQGSMDSNTFNCLAVESQTEEPNPENFWDALIGSIAQQSRDSSKGKSPANQS